MIKRALITGVTGQYRFYLAEILLEKSYEVHGINRGSSSFYSDRIGHIFNDKKYKDSFFLNHGGVACAGNLNRILENIEPYAINYFI